MVVWDSIFLFGSYIFTDALLIPGYDVEKKNNNLLLGIERVCLTYLLSYDKDRDLTCAVYICQFEFALGKRLRQLSWDLLFCSDDLAHFVRRPRHFWNVGKPFWRVHVCQWIPINTILDGISTTKALQIQKSCFDCSNTKCFKLLLGGTKPHFSRETPYFFTASKKQPPKKPRVLSKQPNQQNQLCTDLKWYRGTSRPIKRRVCGCPWSIRGKNWWGGKGPLGMEGPDEIIKPINHYSNTPKN